MIKATRCWEKTKQNKKSKTKTDILINGSELRNLLSLKYEFTLLQLLNYFYKETRYASIGDKTESSTNGDIITDKYIQKNETGSV